MLTGVCGAVKNRVKLRIGYGIGFEGSLGCDWGNIATVWIWHGSCYGEAWIGLGVELQGNWHDGLRVWHGACVCI